MDKFEFPKDFYWGAATSAHQVEGNNHNDWSEWEKATNHPVSGRACDHYNRFREDFDIAKSLSHNAHRFSIEWSRIEPEEGKWDEKEITHYQEVINALRERGIEPFVTLWHWTLPLWVAKQGGWENKKTISDFARYCEKVTQSIQGIKFWITLNEPDFYARNSYLFGFRPPQKKSFFKFLKVFFHLIKAHKISYTIIKKIGGFAGISQNNFYFNLFLNKTNKQQDFIGVNYYKYWNRGRIKNDMDWSIYPKGLYYVLRGLKKFNKPIYITENGLADAKDEKRLSFIKEHIKWIAQAIKEGADVRGYLYWSLLDNFEWDKGFYPRFGLVEMDYTTMKRIIRSSSFNYKKIIEENSVEL